WKEKGRCQEESGPRSSEREEIRLAEAAVERETEEPRRPAVSLWQRFSLNLDLGFVAVLWVCFVEPAALSLSSGGVMEVINSATDRVQKIDSWPMALQLYCIFRLILGVKWESYLIRAMRLQWSVGRRCEVARLLLIVFHWADLAHFQLGVIDTWPQWDF
ncbi:hypothetical protein WMY93_028084, partial [Mugilogobius chulae]